MCTAVIYKNRYFGRNLDYERSFGEEAVVTPCDFPLAFAEGKRLEKHYAIIGMAHVSEDYPLYYDGMNEKGLGMAGLLFSGYAVYGKPLPGKDNIPSWGFIPWILGQCSSVDEAERLMEHLHLTDVPFCDELPPSPLHWMIADRERAIVVEQTADGLHIYENDVGVLTNNPPFPFHLQNLNRYLNLTAEEAVNRFSASSSLHPFSRGMGAIGLPGDWSSPSRFVRGAFVLQNAQSEETGDVVQFFHILDAVQMPRGCVRLENGCYEVTRYASCCDLKEGIYYWKTYEGQTVTKAVISPQTLVGTGLQRLQIEQKNDISHAK